MRQPLPNSTMLTRPACPTRQRSARPIRSVRALPSSGRRIPWKGDGQTRHRRRSGRVAADFHHLLDSATPAELRAPTNGTKWTNRQLLFHMLFGFLLVRALLVLVKGFGRLPDAIFAGSPPP